MSAAIARNYFVRGLDGLRHGSLDTARDDLRAALDMDPGFVDARVAYAGVLARSGDATRASQILRDGLSGQKRPRARVSLLRALGDVLIAAGDYRGAEEAFSLAATAGADAGLPQHDLHDRLARLRAKTGRFPEALDELLAAARSRK